MTGTRIAVLHHARSFFPLDVFQRTRDVAELIWVLDDSFVDDLTTNRLLRRLGTVVDIAGANDAEAAERIALARPDGILSFVDDQMPRAAAIAERLGLRYHTPALARTLTDKGAQREALSRAGIPEPWYHVVAAHSPRDVLMDLADRLEFPCMLKPTTGMGSRGIRLLHDRTELLELTGTRTAHVVEEYLPDRDDLPAWAASYLSVETVVVNGLAHHVALTGRFPLAPPFRETGNFIPALADQRLTGRLTAMVDGAIEALCVKDSLLHTEIKLTPDGPRLIEINGRLGGRPGFVLAEVSDINLFAVACQVAAGIPVQFDGWAPVTGVGFWLMMQPPIEARSISALEGLDGAAALEGVRTVDAKRGPGQDVDWREGTDGQVVTVRGAVPNHAALGELVLRLQKTLRLEYDLN
ncbi:ATP-grasp domain-containing protein [Humibacter sp.]|uniref:ATP-grasp domain-containing protein n=1 Tax=Humibacter sp. TaxID=1940291 RepID=UPI003F7D2F04